MMKLPLLENNFTGHILDDDVMRSIIGLLAAVIKRTC